MITIEKKDGIDVVVNSELPGWTRPASPDEVALGVRIAKLEQELANAQSLAISLEAANRRLHQKIDRLAR